MAEVRVNLRAINRTQSAIEQLREDIASIESKTVKVDVEAVGVDALESRLAQVGDEAIRANVEAVGVDAIESALSQIPDEPVKALVEAVGIDAIESALAAIPDESVKALVETVGVDAVTSALAQIPDESVKAVVEAVGVDAVQSALAAIPDEPVKAIVESVGIDAVTSALSQIPDEAISAVVETVGIDAVTTALAAIPDEPVRAIVEAVGVDAIQSAMASIPDEPVKAVVEAVGVDAVVSALASIPDEPVKAIVEAVGADAVVSALAAIPDEPIKAVVEAVGVDAVTSALNAIPDEPVKAIVEAVGVDAVTSALAQIPDESVRAVVEAVGIDVVTGALAAIPDEPVRAVVEAVGIDAITGALAQIPDEPVKALVEAVGIDAVTSALASIPDEPVKAAVEAVGIDAVSSALSQIPDEQIKAVVEAVGIGSIEAALAAIPDEPVKALVEAVGLDAVSTALSQIPDEQIKAMVEAVGISAVEGALAAIPDEPVKALVEAVGTDAVESALAQIPDEPVKAIVESVGVDAVTSALAAIPDESVKVTAEIDQSALKTFQDDLRAGFQMPIIPGLGGGGGLGMMGGMLLSPGGLAAAGATGLAALLAGGTGQAANLDLALDSLSGSLGIGEDTEDRERLEQLINEIGTGESRFNVFETVAVADMLARNGMTLEAMEMGILEQTLTISEGLAPLGRSPQEIAPLTADLLTDALAQFGLDPLSLGERGGLFAGMTLGSKATVEDVAYMFAQGGGVAGQLGMTIEDFAALGTGVMPFFSGGSDAGTSIKAMLNAIANPSEASGNMMADLGLMQDGVSFMFDPDSGMMRALNEWVADLEAALSPLSDLERGEALFTIFGADAARVAGGAVGMGAVGFESIMIDLQQASVDELKAIKDENVKAEWDKLTGKLETILATAFAPMADALQALLANANRTLDYWLSDDQGKTMIKQEAALERAQEAWQDQAQIGMELFRAFQAGGASDESLAAQFGPNLELVKQAANQAFIESLQGEDAPGWFNWSELFDEEEITALANESIAALESTFDANAPELTVHVNWIVGDIPALPDVSFTQRAQPTQGTPLPGGRGTWISPANKGVQEQNTVDREARGQTSLNGGGYDTYENTFLGAGAF